MARRDAAGPYNLEALRALAAPALFERDPAVLKSQLVAWFEGETNRTLYPMQIEMLLIDMCAYLWSLINSNGQIAHEQRYATLAGIDWLQHLGAQPGIETPMLGATRAKTRLRFSLSAPAGVATVIPLGTRVGAGTDDTVFQTAFAAQIPAGALIVEVEAFAAAPGAAANDLRPGAISALLDPVAGVAAAVNITTSADGADAENADAYRLRLVNALEKASICGQRMGYVEHTMALSADIIDCGAVRPQPCYVDLYPLTTSGAASPTLRAGIKAAIDSLQEQEILPMGDLVTVKPVVDVVRELRLHLVISTADQAILDAAHAAALTVTEPWARQLAPEVVPQAVRDVVRAVPGVVNVETPGFVYEKLGGHQRAVIDVFPPIVDGVAQ